MADGNAQVLCPRRTGREKGGEARAEGFATDNKIHQRELQVCRLDAVSDQVSNVSNKFHMINDSLLICYSLVGDGWGQLTGRTTHRRGRARWHFHFPLAGKTKHEPPARESTYLVVC